MEKRKPGFLESFGRNIDESFKEAKDDIHEGAERVRRGVREIFGLEEAGGAKGQKNGKEDAMAYVKRVLMSRLEDIAAPVGEDFSYSTVLRWVKDNHVGNRFYMVKFRNTKSKNTYLFVFFGRDDELMCDEKSPMICYIVKSLPEGISDMFNGKEVFIQKFE